MTDVKLEVRVQPLEAQVPKNCIALGVGTAMAVDDIAVVRNTVRVAVFHVLTRADTHGRGAYVPNEGFLTVQELVGQMGNEDWLGSLHRKVDAMYGAIQEINLSRVQFSDPHQHDGKPCHAGMIVIASNVDFEAMGKPIQ